MEAKDKQIIESYKLATIRNDIGIYGQRLLLRIVEAVQAEMEGLDLSRGGADLRKHNITTETSLFGDKQISMSLRAICGDTNNITETLKDQIKALQKATFEYENDEEWVAMCFLSKVAIEKGSMKLTVDVRSEVWTALMDFSKGFRKFSLPKAMEFKSAYSLRFYQLFARQTTPIAYKVADLRKMFGLEKKYKTAQHFIEKTIDVAKAELDKCSPYTFDYEPQFTSAGRGRPALTSILFFPKYQRKFDTQEGEYQDLAAKYPGAVSALTRAQEQRLNEKFGITHRGIVNNHRLFEAAVKHLDFDAVIDKIAVRVAKLRPKSPTGYLITALQGELTDAGIAWK